jgi:hypothetical protein
MARIVAFLRHFFSLDYTFTKRHLGLVMAVGGVLGFFAILAVDIIDVGREGGIGPAQRIALVSMVVSTLVGLTLLPLGDKPA